MRFSTPLALLLCAAALPVVQPAHAQKRGDILITEVMVNPNGPPSDPTNTIYQNTREWFELYNTTGAPIDLISWGIQDSTSIGLRPYHYINRTLVLQPHGFLILGNSTDTAVNGGAPVDYAYGTALQLSSSRDKIRLVSPCNLYPGCTGYAIESPSPYLAPDSAVIARAGWLNATTIVLNGGYSRELKDVGQPSPNMDSDSYWATALASSTYGTEGTNHGTPGAPGQTFGALPVELLAFDARADGAAVAFAWRTASETNNAGFFLDQQRLDAPGGSTANGDEASFRRVAFLPGHGTTSEAQLYRHRLDALAPGRYRFRLRQVDLDGTAHVSPAVEVTIEPPSALTLSLPRPNPAAGQAFVTLTVPSVQAVRVRVYDGQGREVAEAFSGEVAPSSPVTVVVGRGLAAGVYVVRAVGARTTATQTVTIHH